MLKDWIQELERAEPELIEVRRYLHRHPELSGKRRQGLAIHTHRPTSAMNITIKRLLFPVRGR